MTHQPGKSLHDLFPHASASFLALNAGPAAVVERHLGDAALGPAQAKAVHPGRVLVRVTSYRHRLLDEDNLCEKYHVDCLRYAGIVQDDSAEKARIEVSQIKVGRKEEERVEITVTALQS